MDVEEHFYADDPAVGPPDARTNLRGVDYFFLGNGLIQAVVQVCRGGGATPLGLLIMSPSRFGPKRAALTFHPERGLQLTAIVVTVDGRSCTAEAGSVTAAWTTVDDVPAVHAVWRNGSTTVEETFHCPDRSKPTLLRCIRVSGVSSAGDRVEIRTGPPENTLWRTVAARGDETPHACLAYRLHDAGDGSAVETEWCEPARVSARASSHALGRARFDSTSAVLNGLFRSARNQLPAVLGATGTMDGSIWQYNLEWVRDQAMVVRSLLMMGETAQARIMLERLLTDFVTNDGDTIDSGRTREAEDVELDQNGELLSALRSYVDWTGEADLVGAHWDKIRACAEFPLRDAFRHDPSGLLHNAREYWERHGMHGIEDSMELMNQFYISLGLSDAAHLARLKGRRNEAARWAAEAARLRDAMLNDPVYALVDDGRFIKRRGTTGEMQATIIPPPGIDLPEDIPLLENGPHRLNPDAGAALPIAMEFIDPKSELARCTLDDLDALWNLRWEGGGYGRYHTSSEPDSPGPWPFPSMFIARALLEAGDDEKVWRVLEWMHDIGGSAGTWLEFYGPRPSPPYPQIGIPPWTWAEIICFFVHHLCGVRPGIDRLVVRPRSLRGLDRFEAAIPFRGRNIRLCVRLPSASERPAMIVDGEEKRWSPEGVELGLPDDDLTIEVVTPP